MEDTIQNNPRAETKEKFIDTCLVEHNFSRNKIAKEMVFNLIILTNNKIQRFDRLGHLQVNEKILKLYCNE